MERTPTQDYFTEEEWEKFPEYEKSRLNTKMANFFAMKTLGFNPPLPDFVVEWRAKEKAAADKAARQIEKENAKEQLASAASEKSKPARKRKPVFSVEVTGGKRVMTEGEVEAVSKLMELKEKRVNAVEKLRLLALTFRQDFHGFSDEDIAVSKAVASRLQSLLREQEALYEVACLATANAREALRRAEEAVDSEAAAASASARRRRRAVAKKAKKAAAETRKLELGAGETRYPRRHRPEVDYAEPDLPDDDAYLYCDRCAQEHEGVCPVHGKLQFVMDRQLPKGYKEPDRAARTLPAVFAIGESSVKGAGLGVWTRKAVPAGIVFGPYEGSRVRVQGLPGEDSTGYSWVIKRASKVVQEVDASDSSKSNWMRYVNCAAFKQQQNFVPFQFQGRLYYRTVREVPAHTELMVYYGDSYAKQLGIDVSAFHRGSVSLAPPAVFACANCPTAFTNPIRRDRHERVSCRRRRFDEPVKVALPYVEPERREIPAVFRLSAALNEPGPEGKKRHKCGECSYSTDISGHFKQHVKTHTGERAFQCSKCSYKTSYNSSLQSHMLTHSGVKPFACGECDFRAAVKSSLTAHLRIHTGEKPFKCNSCDYACNRSDSLQRHVRAKHTKERLFACTYCSYTCVESGQLTSHVATHTGEKKFRCLQCDFKSIRAGNLKRHMSSKHGAEVKYECARCSFKCYRPGQLEKHAESKHAESKHADSKHAKE